MPISPAGTLAEKLSTFFLPRNSLGVGGNDTACFPRHYLVVPRGHLIPCHSHLKVVDIYPERKGSI